jgi:hypothetical protein
MWDSIYNNSKILFDKLKRRILTLLRAKFDANHGVPIQIAHKHPETVRAFFAKYGVASSGDGFYDYSG